MASSSNSILPQDKEQGQTLSSRELLETRRNSRVVRVEGDHPFNRTGIPFQAFCSSSELNCNPKKGAIAVTIYNGVWHHVKIAKTGPALAEPLPSVHIYNKEEELLQTALREVNLNKTLTAEEDKPEMQVQIRMENSSDDEREDPVDQQIRNSPIQPLIPLQQVLARIAMATMTIHTTTIPKMTSKNTTTSSSTDIAMKFQREWNKWDPQEEVPQEALEDHLEEDHLEEACQEEYQQHLSPNNL